MAPRLGEGALISVLVKYVHPTSLVLEANVNTLHGERLKNCRVLRQEVKKIRNRNQLAVVFVNDSFAGDNELYCAKRWAKVTEEGDPNLFFATTNEPEEEEEEEPIAEEMERVIAGLDDEGDRIRIREHVKVDDDNLPAPENDPHNTSYTRSHARNPWGHDGVCFRKLVGGRDSGPSLVNVSSRPSLVEFFEIFFPVLHINTVMLPLMNDVLQPSVTYGEFLRWLGLWFLMATIQGPARKDFWSTAPIDPWSPAPFRLSEYMSRRRFDNILEALVLTNERRPTYKDRFWSIRQIVAAWKENMLQQFVPGWINCLDESMSVWTNKYTCPGFMHVPRKPWPFGNEWHTICCGICGVLFDLEIVEGSDRPRGRDKPEFENLGKTVGLLLRLTRSLWNTSKVVVLDSGFCVLLGLIELRKKGVFAAALIKKRRYWPKYVNGRAVKSFFAEKDVGYADAQRGTLDNVNYYIYGMREPDYTMMMMTTYGTLNRSNGRTTSRIWKQAGVPQRLTFNYPEVINNHYKYRHLVDDHNSKRHQPISLEVTWATSRWECRVFAFLLAVTEVNIFLADNFFFNGAHSCMLGFRKLFAYALIFNKYYSNTESESISPTHRTRRQSAHHLITIPPYKKFRQDGVLIKTGTQYNQRKCQDCDRRVRTYCNCSPGVHRCADCFSIHCVDEAEQQ